MDVQYALEVYAEPFVSEHYTSGRSQLEAKRYIREVSVFIPTLADLKRCNAQSWLRAEVKKPITSRRAVKTMQKGAGFLSEYFAWLRSSGLVPPDSCNPFKELYFSKALSRSRQYLPLSTVELQQMRNASEENSDDLLTTYIDIARFTGMRLSEIGELTSQSVVVKQGFKCFRVRPDGKTEAMNHEGTILLNVMMKGVENERVVLPIHDAVAVKQRDRDRAVRTLKEQWYEHFGFDYCEVSYK